MKNMAFFKHSTFGIITAICLAACGNGGSEAPSQENSVSNQEGTMLSASESQAETPTAPIPVAAPTERALSPEFAALPAPYNEADYARGRRQFRLCASCHLVEDGAGHLLGPNLHAVFGRQVGAAEGFNYSNALQEADFVWSPQQLDSWLADPRGFLPGNKMTFTGIRRPEDRDAVIAYMLVETAPE